MKIKRLKEIIKDLPDEVEATLILFNQESTEHYLEESCTQLDSSRLRFYPGLQILDKSNKLETFPFYAIIYGQRSCQVKAKDHADAYFKVHDRLLSEGREKEMIDWKKHGSQTIKGGE